MGRIKRGLEKKDVLSFITFSKKIWNILQVIYIASFRVHCGEYSTKYSGDKPNITFFRVQYKHTQDRRADLRKKEEIHLPEAASAPRPKTF